MGVGAGLDAVELFGAYFGEEAGQPDLPGEPRDFFLQVEQLLEADVEEVPGPARRVEHADGP